MVLCFKCFCSAVSLVFYFFYCFEGFAFYGLIDVSSGLIVVGVSGKAQCQKFVDRCGAGEKFFVCNFIGYRGTVLGSRNGMLGGVRILKYAFHKSHNHRP